MAVSAAYPCVVLAAATTKHYPFFEADISARLVTTTMRHRWSLCCPTASTPPRLPAPQLHCANTRLPTSCTSSTLALCFLATGSDLNADPERFTSTDEYSSSLPYAGPNEFASSMTFPGSVLGTKGHRWKCAFRLAAAAVTSSEDSSSDGLKKQSSQTTRKRWQLPPEWEELMTPIPEPPSTLVLLIGFSIIYFTRRAIAAELIQWASLLAMMCLTAFHYMKVLLIVLLNKAIFLLKDPIAHILTLAGWSFLFVRDMYRGIVSTTSVWPTLQALLLVTAVLSVGEATRANAVSEQPWAFLIATVLGVGAVSGVINHTVFVLSLLLSAVFSLVVQKKDPVCAFLPMTALLVGIAEVPLKAAILGCFIILAIYYNWKDPKGLITSSSNKQSTQPAIMSIVAFMLGLTIGSRYLHAMHVMWLAKF